jgi:hypothetical protein
VIGFSRSGITCFYLGVLHNARFEKSMNSALSCYSDRSPRTDVGNSKCLASKYI